MTYAVRKLEAALNISHLMIQNKFYFFWQKADNTRSCIRRAPNNEESNIADRSSVSADSYISTDRQFRQ